MIGIGINVRMPPEQAKLIDQPWIDLTSLSSEAVDRNLLSATLISELECLLPEYEKKGLKSHLERWLDLDCFLNKPVNVLLADQNKAGICRGINESGALLLEVDGKVETYIGGEVSLRLA